VYIYEVETSELADWIRAEISLQDSLMVGASGLAVRRVQEWLTLYGYALATDGIYGPVTREAVSRFQESSLLDPTGNVDEATFACLVQPILDTLHQRLTMSEPIGTAILEYARAHLDQQPREVGKQNYGPWVRLYMNGNEGNEWPWCAGFVTFILHQAAESLQVESPIEGSFSCDALAAQAQEAGLFLSESEVKPYAIPPGSLFLVRRTDTDWTHVGIVEEANEEYFRTIEGNTNDAGEREGYEVCARWRSYSDKSFILLP
jgi:hypothetical protein